MKKIQIKIDPHNWIMLFGYDKEAQFPWRELPQLLVSNEDSKAYVYLIKKRVDELISALQEIKKTFPKKGGIIMIEEQFVSFNTAEMLKEAGFDIPINMNYTEKGGIKYNLMPNNFNKFDDKFSRPTQALAARWLREAHGIHVSSNIFMDYANDADGNTVDEWNFWSYDLFDNSGRIIEESDDRYDSYEESLEAGLQEAIKLLKK